MSARTSLTILAIVGLLAAVIIPLAFCANDKATSAEISGWQFGTYGVHCPPMQLRCGPSLTREQCADVWVAAAQNEKALDRKLYTKAEASPTIVVHARRPVGVDGDGLCANKDQILGALGRTYRTPTWGDHIVRFDVLVCFQKIKLAKDWRDQSVGLERYNAIKTVSHLGNIGHIRHEILHPYLGDQVGNAHPIHGSGLMMAQPKSTAIGPVVRGIFQRIDAHCSRPTYHKSGVAR